MLSTLEEKQRRRACRTHMSDFYKAVFAYWKEVKKEMRFPDDTQHLSIVGKNGSGKTQAAVWHLSRRSFDEIPWIVLNHKRDALVDEIYGIQKIDLDKKLPKKPGIYVAHPVPQVDDDAQEEFLRAIWNKENIGLYVDEGYMLKRSKAFDAILTQGRSKHIPVIVLSQRPVWLSRFVFSEATFFQVFRCTDYRDRQTVANFVPADLEAILPPYHSLWYDSGQDTVYRFRPVPSRGQILDRFHARMRPRIILV